MPKYYVSCLDKFCILDAEDPLDACVLACQTMNTMTAGIAWCVSERGFEKHEDDEFVSDELIIRELLRRNKERDV